MQRIAFGIEYDGTNYCGWQRQNHSSSIQAEVELAISKVANHPVNVFCAGRTDTGVHALGQVIHFDTSAIRQEFSWLRGVNTYLPKDIRVTWCRFVSSDFDARRSALNRRYCYVIINRPVSPGVLQNAMTWIYGKLCVQTMKEGARHLLGSHDFTSFRGAHCQAKSSIRTIQAIEVSQRAEFILLDVTANAFLHHMVRNIAGALIAVGQQKYPPIWVKELLEAKNRRLGGVMAPANGLYLLSVGYMPDKNIPSSQDHPWFF
ncbi:MAG: tRNA pseudouridine(38-40) synthase TruA [Proteobacteria bacterium]|nr:tRNA pseudouridine(38-40) synthase TruA [Pseudomonadota bacterium]